MKSILLLFAILCWNGKLFSQQKNIRIDKARDVKITGNGNNTHIEVVPKKYKIPLFYINNFITVDSEGVKTHIQFGNKETETLRDCQVFIHLNKPIKAAYEKMSGGMNIVIRYTEDKKGLLFTAGEIFRDVLSQMILELIIVTDEVPKIETIAGVDGTLH